MRYLVTVNRNVKYSTQVGIDANNESQARELALDTVTNDWRFPEDFDINEDSEYFVSYLEEAIE